MTRAEISTMIAGVGIPYAFDHFDDEDGAHPQGPPFICFMLSARDDFHADNGNYVKVAQLVIELYTDDPDFTLEAAVESALTTAGLGYQRGDQSFIDSEQMYQTIYNTEVLLTDG